MAWYDTGSISSTLMTWLTSFVFWFIVLTVVLVFSFVMLKVRRNKKLKIRVVEIIDLGNGKIAINSGLKAGWFKSKKTLFGLFDYGGEDVCECADGRLILEGSSEDYHDINGVRGLMVRRKSDDPKILVPISKFELDDVSQEMIMSIAPADFRDASGKIIARTDNEMQGKMEKYLPWISLMVVSIVMLICIILIVQMVKQGQTEAKNLILEAGRMTLESGKNAVASTTAP
jgi:uncharacterized membrane protein